MKKQHIEKMGKRERWEMERKISYNENENEGTSRLEKDTRQNIIRCKTRANCDTLRTTNTNVDLRCPHRAEPRAHVDKINPIGVEGMAEVGCSPSVHRKINRRRENEHPWSEWVDLSRLWAHCEGLDQPLISSYKLQKKTQTGMEGWDGGKRQETNIWR